jgi:hypothetical protein
MSSAERVEGTRRTLSATVMARALLWAFAAGVVTLALLAALDAAIALPRLVRALALPAGAILAILAGARAAWLGRFARSRERVALWIEERTPALRYALATLSDERLTLTTAAPELERIVAAADWSGALRSGVVRALAVPAALLAAGSLALALLPPAAIARVSRPHPGDVLDAVSGARGRRSALTPLVATVTPPAYTGRAAVTFEEPASVPGIAGSEVVVAGQGDGRLVRATLGSDSIALIPGGTRWTARFRMPETAVALRLGDGVAERLVIIEPYPDSAPVVSLRLPARDTVFRTTSLSLNLAADLRDDIGLSEAWFEYIVTSGEMESFQFRSGVLQLSAFSGARTGSLNHLLSLAWLRLGPGDVVHLRAVATDANNATGPGRGASETRTIRIARPGEFDALAIEGLPSMMGDTAALSQRMLIMLAEALERRRTQLGHDTVVRESRAIAADQARLRRRIADIIFMRVSGEASAEDTEGGSDEGRPATPEQVLAAAESVASRNAGEALDFASDESPVIAINRPLLEAYNAMWDAGRELEIGEPGDALPHMRVALAAIQRARAAERLYLRGRPPTAVVDLRSARLAGDRSGVRDASRVPGAALGAERSRLASRLSAALALAAVAPGAAADSLLLLRLEALGRFPAFASAAGRAASRLRAGNADVADLLRVRTALLGEPRHDSALPVWESAR